MADKILSEEELAKVSGGATGSYIVRPEDTYEGIAAKLNIPLGTLISMNGIKNPNIVVVGQKLIYPC